jgi:hypothetical protein
MEKLDALEAPMSDAFWTGVGVGVAIVACVAAIVVLT